MSIRRRGNVSSLGPQPHSDTIIDSTNQTRVRVGKAPKRNRYQLVVLAAALFAVISSILFLRDSTSGRSSNPNSDQDALSSVEDTSLLGEAVGHGDFDDGRKRTVKEAFLQPQSDALHWVNVMLGNGGPEPNLSGGMIPAVAPPFGMTRWTPQTRMHYVSMCPYNQTDAKLHGFVGTHQPAIWMGESGPVQIAAGLGAIVTDFETRALPFDKKDEYASANYYSNVLDVGEDGKIQVEMSATSRVGHLRFTFDAIDGAAPHVVLDASRESRLIHGDDTGNLEMYYPSGEITVDVDRREVYGWNEERQDKVLVGTDLPAKGFKAYFVARFSEPLEDVGISHRGVLEPGIQSGFGQVLSSYVTFAQSVKVVDVRVGVSFISIEQARKNLDTEIPDGTPLESTSSSTRSLWANKLDTLKVEGATPHNLTVLYTSFAHTLVYPYEIHEPVSPTSTVYYSGYLDTVMPGISYSGYSIWDTFRAQTAWLLLTSPERVGDMITSMLQDYQQGGWLPMWKNIVETNIMIGTHADSVIAQAMDAGEIGFDWDLAWEAVRKNTFIPPDRDTELREEGTPQEARAGLTDYARLGYVAEDLHAESGSRTLDYAYDDWAASIVADHVGEHEVADMLRQRSKSYRMLWNSDTGFMEARNSDGSWAGESVGWTEGDHWAYSLDVMHYIPGLIELMGGNQSFIDFMDRHFDGGHNLHTNEPSLHIPYMYTYAGAPHKGQEKIRHLGENDYNHTAGGLSGNEDCGQMSAWYLFSAMGFYPVDPASTIYVIGAPFFDSVTFQLPNAKRPIQVTAKGASSGKKYVKSVTLDGVRIEGVTIEHEQLRNGADLIFEMSGSAKT